MDPVITAVDIARAGACTDRLREWVEKLAHHPCALPVSQVLELVRSDPEAVCWVLRAARLDDAYGDGDCYGGYGSGGDGDGYGDGGGCYGHGDGYGDGGYGGGYSSGYGGGYSDGNGCYGDGDGDGGGEGEGDGQF